MKKALRITLKSLAIVVGVAVVGLTTTTVVNAVASGTEAANLKPYGQLVDVDGKNMNVTIAGSGPETVVLIPGFGTSAPALDFLPLIEELAPDYRVVAVEPFGYGLSDATDVPRTTTNIVSEIHTAVESLGLTEYVLMGHSIAGIYGMEYANTYRSEVTAFVGIDSSVPDQPGMEKGFPIAAMGAAKNLGLARILVAAAGDPYAGLPYDDETRAQAMTLTFRNSMAPTYLNEMDHIASNFVASRDQSFPSDLPLLEFVQANNTGVEGWIPLHEEQIAGADHGELVILDADHYLHHTKSKEIAASFRAFMAEL